MKIKFKPGEKVQLISGTIVYINSINIYNGYINYNVWDGLDKFLNTDEWQIKKLDKKQIGFNVEF